MKREGCAADSAGGRWEAISLQRRRLESDVAAAAIVALVAGRAGVPVDALLRPSRGPKELAAARQLAMYLIHVDLGRTFAEVGLLLGRDRTTVSYACALVEDSRDDPSFEARVGEIEAAIAADAIAEQHHVAA